MKPIILGAIAASNTLPPLQTNDFAQSRTIIVRRVLAPHAASLNVDPGGYVKLTNDINHLTFITGDIDRLISFYQRVFEAPVTLDLTEDGLRHVFLEVGPHTVLHPFQITGITPPPPAPMFQRGRLDHFALNAASEAAFRELRRRAVAEGASNGIVTDMGSLLIFTFNDPDGGAHEVVWMKPDMPVAATLKRADWTQAPME